MNLLLCSLLFSAPLNLTAPAPAQKENLILDAVAIVLAYPVWSAIHEESHILVADQVIGVNSVRRELYPQISDNRLYWAKYHFNYDRKPTIHEIGLLSIAPRGPDLFAAVVAPMLWSLGYHALALLAYGGVVDLIVGSIGTNYNSDLQRASRGLGIKVWKLRLVGLGSAGLSILGGILGS